MTRVEQISAVLIGFLLITIPFMMGDYKELARLEIVIVGMLLWVLLLWNGFAIFNEYKILSIFTFLLLAAIGLYAIPLPVEFIESLPGREVYGSVEEYNELTLKTISLIPQDTLLTLVYASAMAAVFFTMLSFSYQTIEKLLFVLGCIVIFQASLGIIQYASGVDHFYIGMQEHGNTASGTYRNRDHYVALLEMAIPFIVAFMSIKTKNQKSEILIGRVLGLSIVLILVVVASILSGSRAGITLAILGLMLSVFIMSMQYGKLKSFGFIAVTFIVVIGVAANIGVVSIINRFSVDPLEDLRWQIFNASEVAIQSMWPLGSGPGTFPEVFRMYQPLEMPRFINHAHNDYYELIFDLGIAGVGIIAGVFLIYGFRWLSLLRGGGDNKVQIAAGISIALLMLHSYFDFNLYIPYNALVAIVVFSIFLKRDYKCS
ncbi:MAG: Unknown protein [uncultured Thiotrichaceae bacterium]|uniref:O-antigen ligase-related domain-containing protein n=1 Tax=uncultured Thiotrichaceae bacterium TaxID=298394 RepID=A0A6S6TBE9_9GAMM|nr:MAG: Unknown protein [uncultured Thiotrichaceae bacterium]